MPPRIKFDKQQIADSAFDIVRKEGLGALTARALGARLGCSVCPIFTVFKNMDEVISEVIAKAKNLYADYVRRGLSCKPAFKGVGEQYIRFALEEPKLFAILFMSERHGVNQRDILNKIDDNYLDILQSIIEEYGFDVKEAEKLYMHMWIYTHGIATLCATSTCVFEPQDISGMLTQVFRGVITQMKKGAEND